MVKTNPKYKNIKSVGVGSLSKDTTNPDPTLDTVSEYQYVTLHNPLPFDFVGQVAQSRPVDAPMRIIDGKKHGVDESMLRSAGLDLRNTDHPSKQHVTIQVKIESNQTINLRGDEAKVIIRQLVNEVMSYENNTLRQGSPSYRKEVEDRLIKGIRSIDDLIESRPSENELIDTALQKENEKSFPSLEIKE